MGAVLPPTGYAAGTIFWLRDTARTRGNNPVLKSFIERSRHWARGIKRDAITLWFARKHPDMPWYAKAMGALVLAYALSPIDLIPDFIPVLGYLDDVILLPCLIWLTLKLIPATTLADSRLKAEAWMASKAAKPKSAFGAAVIVALWAAVAVMVALWFTQGLG